MASAVFNHDPVFDIHSPDFFVAEPVRSFWAHMFMLGGSDGIVRAGAFDIMAIHRLAPDIMICDVDTESCRHRLRFVGTRVVEALGRETTGHYLDEIDMGPYRSQQLAAFNMAVASRLPQWTRLSVVRNFDVAIGLNTKACICFERLVVPLAGPHGPVTQLVAFTHCARGDSRHDEFEHRELGPAERLVNSSLVN